jgi:hypothetical protein
MKPRLLMLVAVIAFAAAVAGVYIGRFFSPVSSTAGVELHEVLHEKLDLDDRQTTLINVLEQRFAVRRKALELELRADNARLADAIEAEHDNGPRVIAAVDQSHQAMGELQKETLGHIFAMRQVLRPNQAKTFDQAVVRALTDDVR